MAQADPITTEEIEAHIRFLADPVTQGRGLGSQGLEIASLYIESQFREAGLRPAFDGSYRQEFELLGSTPDPQARLSFPGSKLTYGQDFVVFTSREDAPTKLSGELVYAGYLIQAPERQWDDLKGSDLKDKILLVEVNEPGNHPEGIFEGPVMTYYGRWTYKYEQAARLGARGILLVHNPTRATYGWDVVRNSWSQEGFTIPGEALGSPFEGWVTEAVARQLCPDYDQLLARAETPDFRPVPLGVTVEVEQHPKFRRVKTANVGGLLPGTAESAPTLVVTAHHDHWGVDPKGGIYAGVVDNCSAVASMLALARHFSDQPLAANLLFVAVSAEEQGLWGSRYLAAHPPVPADELWANLNLEMTNIWGPTRDAYAIGADLSDLDEVARQAASQVGLRYIPERDKENGFFFRSDQFSFARAGVPGLWPHEGPTSVSGDALALRQNYRAQHYHKTSDSLPVLEQEWNLDGTRQMAEWAAAILELLAERDTAPQFKPSSGFAR